MGLQEGQKISLAAVIEGLRGGKVEGGGGAIGGVDLEPEKKKERPLSRVEKKEYRPECEEHSFGEVWGGALKKKREERPKEKLRTLCGRSYPDENLP